MPGFLLDTSVMVATVCAWHEHHHRAVHELDHRLAAHETLLLAAPALVETYAVLTRLPPPHRLSPEDADALLDTNFLASGTLIALDPSEYRSLLKAAASHGMAGGRTYDWVIATCATKAKAATLLTFNRRDFLNFPLASLDVCAPGGGTT